MARSARATFELVIVGLVIFFNTTESAASQTTKLSQFNRCYIDHYDGHAVCAEFSVPLDWDNPTGKKLRLHLAKIPSVSLHPAEPLILLAGGPGQAAGLMGRLVDTAFTKVLRSRDIILMDQRGTGGSHPLDCHLGDSFAIDTEVILQAVATCAKQLDIDPNYFGTHSAIKDIDALRQALGYTQINLWGGSYGTRVALLYAAQFPQQARSLIIDSVTPPSMPIYATTAQSSDRAFRMLLSDCQNSPACAQAFPNLGERFLALLSNISEQPLKISLKHPLTGKNTEFVITAEFLTGVLHSGMYTPQRRIHLPIAMASAVAGDFSSLFAISNWFDGNLSGGIHFGLMMSVLCAEDIPRISPEQAQNYAQGTYAGDTDYSLWRDICGVWPVTPSNKPYDDPAAAPPTLLLSGILDPITPPSLAQHVAAKLPVYRHIVVQHRAHIVSIAGCMPDLMTAFIETLDLQVLDTTCLDKLKAVPFITTATGGPA